MKLNTDQCRRLRELFPEIDRAHSRERLENLEMKARSIIKEGLGNAVSANIYFVPDHNFRMLDPTLYKGKKRVRIDAEFEKTAALLKERIEDMVNLNSD